MFKIGIFVQTKNGSKLVKWLPNHLDSSVEAEIAVNQKNIDLGNTSDHVPMGRKFAMFDNA